MPLTIPPPHAAFDYSRSAEPPYELIEVPPNGDFEVPAHLRRRILIHTVHDGGAIPLHFRFRPNGEPLVDLHALEQRYIRERDWGANLVARKLCESLGVGGFARCRVARVLCDFNRFPGCTPPNNTDPLHRLAISEPFSEVLSHGQKLELLESYYDRISDLIEGEWLVGNLIMIGIHTYDERNASQTRRPHLSVMSGVASYLRDQRMPYGVFDPLYPDLLGESTCSRTLRDRVSLNLQRNGFRVSHNYPYALPEGSMEVRAQVWYFFDYLRRRFVEAHPETVGNPAYELTWTMLLNTNLRLHEAESLRGYLHRFRRVSRGERDKFHCAEEAYAHVRRYVEQSTVVRDYRFSPDRPSSFALEVRKDLVCSFDPVTKRPLPLTEAIEQRAALIGRVVAGAITTYFETDLQFEIDPQFK